MFDLHGYNVIIIPIVVGFVAQSTKFSIFVYKHGLKWEYFLSHGHMPSAHTAFVVSSMTSLGYYEGLNSGVFALSVIFAILIIDDALRLRMYLGDQGRYLNMLIEQLQLDQNSFPRLKERVGHRLSEVIVGGIYGFILSVLLIAALG